MSLIPGRILRGCNWDYRVFDPVEADGTHTSTVFKAEVLARDDDSDAPKWALIKAALPGNKTAIENLDRECQNYLLPGIASSACFRKIYDVISESNDDYGIYVALEWLDTTLAEVEYQPGRETNALVEAVLSAALASCTVLDRQKYVNTDYKSANILLSNVNTRNICAKVGDLGLVFPAGSRFEAQPYAMRAPEVFLGQACTKTSQVWAIAAMLLCWIKPGILGAWDSPHHLIDTAWCMAKIKRLFPDWQLPSPSEVSGDSLAAALESAGRMSREEPGLQAIEPLEQEIRSIEMPEQLRSLLSLILVPEAVERPSASSVLASREFQDFKDFVRVH